MNNDQRCMYCGRTDAPPYTSNDNGVTLCAICKDNLKSAVDPFGNIPAGTLCRNCGKHPATCHWYGDNSGMDIIHGALVFAWCTCCVLTEQLKHAEKQAARIPLLKEQLNHPCADMTAVEGP